MLDDQLMPSNTPSFEKAANPHQQSTSMTCQLNAQALQPFVCREHSDAIQQKAQAKAKQVGSKGYVPGRIWKQLSSVDAESVYEHFMTLSKSSLRSRFDTEVTPTWLSRYVAGFFQRPGQMLGAIEDGKLTALGELRPSLFSGPSVCELGLSISCAKQGQGIGRELLSRLSALAIDQGYQKLELFVDAQNTRMKSLCNGMEADWTRYKRELCAIISLA